MPDRAALITALILERPTCLVCVTAKATLSPPEVLATIAKIEVVLHLHRFEGRCRGCGETTAVLSIDRPGELQP